MNSQIPSSLSCENKCSPEFQNALMLIHTALRLILRRSSSPFSAFFVSFKITLHYSEVSTPPEQIPRIRASAVNTTFTSLVKNRQ